MSFFKDLKEDIAQSVNELTESLDDNLGGKEQDIEVKADFMQNSKEEDTSELRFSEVDVTEVSEKEDESGLEDLVSAAAEEEAEPADESVLEPENSVMNEEEPVAMSGEIREETALEEEEEIQEVTVITKGTTISGGIKSDTSLVVKGTIEGDVECDGKLTITGHVSGNTTAAEIYVNTPRLEGDINSKGFVKIDVGTVVIGKVICTSVVVAGAVKGDIEVNGPVVIDSTAVVKGDIKAKSIQVNSGAVIDGHCSLPFADVDLDSFFE